MEKGIYQKKTSDNIYVTGHINPDTDSIASAMGYAWLLRERDGLATIPSRAGAVNMQTSFVLKTLGIEAPVLMTDASPRFEGVMRRLDVVTPEKSLNEAWTILNRTGGIAPVVNEDGTPYGMVTGTSVFEFLRRILGPHPRFKDMTISEMLDIHCQEAATRNLPKFQPQTRIKDVLNRLLRLEFNEYWVVDEQNRYLGVVRQRDILHPPRIKVVLVDHNEPQQSIASLEESELLEILDHHRLGNQSTRNPIKFTVDIVGSTSTLVAEQIAEAGLSAPPELASLLLAGLLSDTLILTSPTTTPRDQAIATVLERWSFVAGSPLENESIQSWGESIINAGAGLLTQDPDFIVRSDMKIYENGGYKFAIAQVETTDLYQSTEAIDNLRQALKGLIKEHGLDFAGLMVTDVVESSSRLIFVNAPAIFDELPYEPLPDDTVLAQGVVSRKKQLLPSLLSLIEV